MIAQGFGGMRVVPGIINATAWGTPSIAYGYDDASDGRFEDEAIFSQADQYWQLKSDRSVIPGMVIYAQSDGGFTAWDPARNYWTERDPVQPDLPPAYRFKPQEVWDGLPIDSPRKLCNGLILDWASWQRENGDAFGQLTRVLLTLSPADNEPMWPGSLTRIGLDDTRDHPTLLSPYRLEVPLIYASAGMRRIVALAYLLVWNWQEHLRACDIRGMRPTKEILFVIDEIEAHLHPRWQRRIVKALLKVMEALAGPHAVSVQMIATTHSPLVLASTEPCFDVEKDAIWELDLVKDKVELKEFPFSRLGDVNQWLTSAAFDLKEPRSLEAEEAITKALALAKLPAPSKKRIDEVDRLLRNALSDVDRFWVRWTEFRRRHEAAR